MNLFATVCYQQIHPSRIRRSVLSVISVPDLKEHRDQRSEKNPKPKRGPKIFSESLEMGFSVETEDSNFRGHTIDCDSISATHHFLMIPVLKQS